MRTRPDWFYTQSAVIPYRIGDQGPEFLLISNRKKTRWIIPKGVKEPHLSAASSAAKEAVEEAGILGTVDPKSIGSYTYDKWGGTCIVEVYLMEVETILDEWPENSRDREWLPLAEAVRKVDEPRLKQLLLAAVEKLAPA